jgi:hypothetical protein
MYSRAYIYSQNLGEKCISKRISFPENLQHRVIYTKTTENEWLCHSRYTICNTNSLMLFFFGGQKTGNSSKRKKRKEVLMILHVRNVSESVYEILQKRANEKGRSLSDFIRGQLEQIAHYPLLFEQASRFETLQDRTLDVLEKNTDVLSRILAIMEGEEDSENGQDAADVQA